jgi:biopolymer transport protein ExbD
MRRRHQEEEDKPSLMLSPMIDMIFLLLVFFMVGTMYMSDIRTIPIRLPKASHSENVSKSNFSVTVKKDGTLYLDEKQIGMKELVANAALESRRDSSFSVIIRAEDDANYKTVITLLDELKGAGVTRFGLATDLGGNHEGT